MDKKNKPGWWSELEKIVEKEIRPSLQMDGGDIRLVDFKEDEAILSVELQGHCAHCPMMEYTLKEGIEAEIISRLPQVKQVVAV